MYERSGLREKVHNLTQTTLFQLPKKHQKCAVISCSIVYLKWNYELFMLAGRKPGSWEESPWQLGMNWPLSAFFSPISSLERHTHTRGRGGGGGDDDIPTLMLGTYNIRFVTLVCCGDVYLFTHLVNSLISTLQFQSALWTHAPTLSHSQANNHQTYR